MKKVICIISLLLCTLLAMGQVNKENAKRAQQLQADDSYICGLGHGNTLRQASNNALGAWQARFPLEWNRVSTTCYSKKQKDKK